MNITWSAFRISSKLLAPLVTRSYYFRSLKDGLGLTHIIRLKISTKMEPSYLAPPPAVKGMVQLDRSVFDKTINIPACVVPEDQIKQAVSVLKKYLLKFEKLKPIAEASDKDKENGKLKRIYLNPLLIQNTSDLSEVELEKLKNVGINEEHFERIDIQLKYDNYKAEEVLKAVLPGDKEGCTSYSRIGHIIHLNLRDHLLPYKTLIGQVMIDKFHGIRTVLNKSHVIDSTYRNFQFEILAGDSDLVAEVKESGCTFKFDFGKVYWNPRLSTEHERIIKLLPQNGRLFDVFAGVGPFTVPAARVKKCHVYANDLNPESATWLRENCRINKVRERVTVFNLDGRQFIREQLPVFLKDKPDTDVHVAMNLPAMAITFVDAFVGLVDSDDIVSNVIVHLYSFCEEDDAAGQIRREVQKYLGADLGDDVLEIVDVRDVAPKKHMMRISFRVPSSVLKRAESPEPKKPKLN